MAEEFGANIATKAGDGEANVWHWEGVQKTINQLYQRDLYHQKMVKDEYTKAQAQLATQAAGLRAADIPDFQKAYNGFREASIMLQDPKVYKNPEQRAYWSKAKDDHYTEALSVVGMGKDAKETQHSFGNHWLQTQGLDAADDYHQKMDMYNNMSSRQIRATNFDTPTNFFNVKDDTPPDIAKRILGDVKNTEERTPLLDPKGARIGDEVSKYEIGSKLPLGVIAYNTNAHLIKYKGFTKAAQQEFADTPPEQAKVQIDAANQLIKQESPQAPPLPYDYIGFQSAKYIVQARSKVRISDPEKQYDKLWFDNLNNQQQWAMHNDSEANTNARFNKTQALMKEKEANKQKRAAALFPEIDTKPIWNALQSNNRAQLKEYLGAIAKNNPEKTIPITISRLDIVDPNTNRGLLTSFGIDPESITYSKGRSPQETRDNRVKAVVDALNKASGGSKISVEDLNSGQVIGGFIHLGTVNLYDGLHNYTGTKQTRLPVLFNAKNSSPEQLQAEISQEYVKKKKQYLEQQDADFEETGAGGAATTATPPPAATTTPPPAATKTPPPAKTEPAQGKGKSDFIYDETAEEPHGIKKPVIKEKGEWYWTDPDSGKKVKASVYFQKEIQKKYEQQKGNATTPQAKPAPETKGKKNAKQYGL